jgi:hypothetical protein
MANMKAKQEAQHASQVMSTKGAEEEMYDLADEEIAMAKRHRAQHHARFTDQTSTLGLETATIPQELAVSIFGQITMGQMKARWQ